MEFGRLQVAPANWFLRRAGVRRLIVIAAVFLAWGSHGASFAEGQGLPGLPALEPPTFRMPQLPALGEYGSPNPACGPLPFLDPTKFYAGYLVENGAHVFHELRNTGTALNNLQAVKHWYPEDGIFLGASQTARPYEEIALALEGWWLLSFEREARSKYVYPWSAPETESTGVTRRWDTKTTGWFIDGSIHFSWMPGAVKNGFSQINGLRYDYYAKSFEMNFNEFVFDSGTDDEMNVEISMLIPYMGAQYCMRGSNYEFVTRGIASPVVYGSIHYGETFGGGGYRDEGTWTFDRWKGFWAELFGSYDRRVSDRVSLGGFLKMTTMSLYASDDLETETVGGGTTGAEYDLIYRRLIYLVGGHAKVSF